VHSTIAEASVSIFGIQGWNQAGAHTPRNKLQVMIIKFYGNIWGTDISS
jgi:hypothetical protein